MNDSGGIRCAIMQPTYLPWMGYFALIGSVDVFIFLDDVEFSHQSWQQRNAIKTKSGMKWLTVPVLHTNRNYQLINEVEINNTQSWRRQHFNTILQSYAKATHKGLYRSWLEELYQTQESSLCELNIRIIQDMVGFLGLKTILKCSSPIRKTDDRIGRLIAYCKAVGADEYLSPPGSFDYIDANNQFEPNNIQLRYLHYEHPTYRQLFGTFTSHLSAIDVLMNEGPDSRDILMSGIRTPYTHEQLRETKIDRIS